MESPSIDICDGEPLINEESDVAEETGTFVSSFEVNNN